MSRWQHVINSPEDRRTAANWCMRAPIGMRIDFKEVKRTLPQNDRMWAMLTDVSQQAALGGKKFTPEQWKVIFLHALGQEITLLPSLDGNSFVPWGQSSSDLSKSEMTDLIELIFKFGAEHGVQFQDEKEQAA
jgi:hypothetical protein